MVFCPECESDLDIDEEEVEEGEVVSCDECGTDFEGGEFTFTRIAQGVNRTSVTLRPKAGLVIVFPSHPWYAHKVDPVTAGLRFSYVSWYSLS